MENLWKEYKGLNMEMVYQAEKEKPVVQKEKSGLGAFIDDGFSDNETADLASRDEYREWCGLERERETDNPIAYWWSNRRRWPRLSRFALDLLAIPAMSAEPERVFSNTGNMVRPNRACLKADIIAASECLKQWERSGAIEWK